MSINPQDVSNETAQDWNRQAEEQSRRGDNAGAVSSDLRDPMSPKETRAAGASIPTSPPPSPPNHLVSSVPSSPPGGCATPASEPPTHEAFPDRSYDQGLEDTSEQWETATRRERIDGHAPDGRVTIIEVHKAHETVRGNPWTSQTLRDYKHKAHDREKQRALGFDGEVLKETIIKKLRSIGEDTPAITLENCHSKKWIQLCTGCRKTTTFYNRCETFFCPQCARRLASERRRSVEWWADRVTQAKHVVLTARNTEGITKRRVQEFKAAFTKLRRRAVTKNWRGGFYAIEITNEGKGWHLHLHALVETRWIDQGKLAKEWAECIGQDFAIVWVKDGRKADYLRELCKYVTDGNQLAGWQPEEIKDYIDAFSGVRTFGCFGVLYKLRKLHREFMESIRCDKLACSCGCTQFRYFDENEWEWFECNNGPNAPPNCSDKGSNPAKAQDLFGVSVS